MEPTVSKSQFKAHMLALLRKVEKTKKTLVLTHNGEKVIKVTPYEEDPEETLKSLRGKITKYEDPFEPVGVEDWEALK